tara:strand:+ start:108 stop:488 length:381 start_codon:yes stop_codon:yes gene_type:complete
MKSKDAYKTIGEVCDIVGLVDSETGKRKTYVIRFWEKHFNELKPGLIYKGRRYYSSKNIEYIKKIKKLLKEDGYTIKGSKKVLTNNNKVLTNNNNIVDSFTDVNIKAKKINNLKHKIKDLKKYLNG